MLVLTYLIQISTLLMNIFHALGERLLKKTELFVASFETNLLLQDRLYDKTVASLLCPSSE